MLAAAGACSGKKARSVYEDVTGARSSNRRHQVDLNTASREQLSKLPGLADRDADNIIAHRPYAKKEGLLNKKVLPQGKYDQVRDYVYAGS